MTQQQLVEEINKLSVVERLVLLEAIVQQLRVEIEMDEKYKSISKDVKPNQDDG